MREPNFSPVGSGLVSDETAAIQGPQAPRAASLAPIGPPTASSTPSRASRRSATSSPSSSRSTTRRRSAIRPGRSQTTKDGVTIDYGFNNGSASSSSKQPAHDRRRPLLDLGTQGQGNIDRSEQIQVSVAAVVTRVLANGNLVISGSQEVRVNYELRQLTVAGIVRPYGHLPQQHDLLRPYRRGAHLLWRPRPRERCPATDLGPADL